MQPTERGLCSRPGDARGNARGGGLRGQASVPKAPFDRLYRDYAAGDRDVVTRTLRTGRDIHDLQPPRDDKKLSNWLGPWDRMRAAFLLELADAESELSAHQMIAISTGRAYVMSRPTPLGQNAEDDAFEAAWHRMALGLLQRGSYAQIQVVYLDTIERRYASVPVSLAPRLDPRFALTRGIAYEQRCALTGLAPDCLHEVVHQYAAAALVEETADEANIRSAWAHYQLKNYPLALETIDRACPIDDPDLMYWMHLFRGRILEALHRLPDAEGEYRLALETRPFRAIRGRRARDDAVQVESAGRGRQCRARGSSAVRRPRRRSVVDVSSRRRTLHP